MSRIRLKTEDDWSDRLATTEDGQRYTMHLSAERIIVPDEPREGLSVFFAIESTPRGIRPKEMGITAESGEEITASDWRRVAPIALWKEAALFLMNEAPTLQSSVVKIGTVAYSSAAKRRPSVEYIANLRSRGPSDETLQFVADRYNEALRISIPPAAHVQDSFSANGKLDPLPRTTATKWIQRARKMGLIADGDD